MSACRFAVAWLVVMLAMAGCSSDLAGSGTPALRATAEPSGPSGADPDRLAGADVPDFTAGLLPAAKFGPDARSEPITAAMVAETDPSRLPDGATLTPPECRQIGDPSVEPTSFAGQLVRVDQDRLYVQTLQTPFAGTPHDPATVSAALAGCELVTVTMPDGAVVRLAQTPLDLGDLGDLGEVSGGRRAVNSVVAADGQQYSTTILFADVVDSDRVASLAMFSLVPNQPVDEAGFRQLVAAAYDHQHDALG